ncbi:MAG: RsmE family RNA methyltransferase [Bacilli bacterium]|nr:RsmE family RNA methyltransferase [Bacilli bacterium]
MQRYFTKEYKNDNLEMNNDDSYHIITVMRMKEKDQFELVINHKLYIAEITSIENKKVLAKIVKEIEDDNNLSMDVTLVQSLIKEQKMDYVLQKSTELGVNKIIPYQATRSIIKVDNKEDKKIERWSKIVKEASEQSKRNSIPEIIKSLNINELIKLEDYDIKILATVNEVSTNIKKVLSNVRISDRIIIVIGPEGGFTEKEEKLLMENGFISTSLGRNVMRTETVGLFILSILQYNFMECE